MMAIPIHRNRFRLFAVVTSFVLVPATIYLAYQREFFTSTHYKTANQKSGYALRLEESNRRNFLVTQLVRRAEVQRHCSQYELDQVGIEELPNKTLSSIIVDDIHHVLYCQVPKVACTNWRRVFLILTGKMNMTDPLEILSDDAHHKYKNHLRYLHQYTFTEKQHRLKHYLKFMISREPLERILSAYRNKFMMKFNTHFRKQYARKIIHRFRTSATSRSEQLDDVSFPEFVRYLLDPRTVWLNPLNEHWIQQYKLCFPCTIDYNFIGRYEDLANDANNILYHMDPNSTVRFPSRDSTYSHSKTSDLLMKYFSQVPNQTLADLYQMYYLDYAIFGYPFPDFLKKLKIKT